MTEVEENCVPVDDLKWKGDTPHPTPPRNDGKLTAETFWLAQSHHGDYHDNMNSERFQQWLKEKCMSSLKSRMRRAAFCTYQRMEVVLSINTTQGQMSPKFPKRRDTYRRETHLC